MAVPLLNFESGPGVPLLIFSGSWVPLLNFEGSWSHFFTMPKDSARFERGHSSKIVFLWNPYKNPNERRKITIFKNVRK